MSQACSCSAAESICQCISISGRRDIKWAALLIPRWDFKPIGKSVPHHYGVCVSVNYFWHQGKFYPGLVCGKSRGFSVGKNWAQIPVLWLTQLVTWGRLISCLGFSRQWQWVWYLLHGLPRAAHEKHLGTWWAPGTCLLPSIASHVWSHDFPHL